jgi:hypothetical protein
MSRFLLSVAAIVATVMAATTQQVTAGKVPGLHIYTTPPAGYGRPRLPRVVRDFNPKQQVRAPTKSISLARRR